MILKSKVKVFVFLFIMMSLIIVFPDISGNGVTRGLIISGNVLIPSLFPFMICVLMIIKTGFRINNKVINKFINNVFGQNIDMFFVFLLSMLGGYPIGARLIKELYLKKIINDRSANIMLMYCVNAGPAFVISVVGTSLMSEKIGIILLVSHVLSSITIAIFCANSLKKQIYTESYQEKNKKTLSSIFVESVTDSSSSIISICGFVITFSVINAYLDYFFSNVIFLKNLSLFTEVTSAVAKCNNIYLIAFLLGFSGLSIWFQVFALLGKIKINIIRFIIGRILHSTVSVIITYVIINLLKIEIYVFSNNVDTNNQIFYSDVKLFFSMSIMIITLLIFIFSKNAGKLINDVI